MLLKVRYYEPPSNFAFKLNLRCYNTRTSQCITNNATGSFNVVGRCSLTL
jgi:hypothetical protein